MSMNNESRPHPVYIGELLDIIETIKFKCRKCKQIIGANVLDEYASSNRIVCRNCGWDNTQKFIDEVNN